MLTTRWWTGCSVAVAVLVAGAGCSSAPERPGAAPAHPGSGATASAPPSATSSPTAPGSPTRTTRPAGPHPSGTRPTSTHSPARGTPEAVLARMSLAQRVGQLFMVGGAATGLGSSTLTAVSERHVGNLMLTGRSSAGTAATAAVVARAQRQVSGASTEGVPLFVATDQEGGFVQVLRGPGVSTIPTALTQGTWSAGTLQSRALAWGRELRRAGVDVDLAPVADTVPSATEAATNPPIGRFRREFGYTTARVGEHAAAFVRGMSSAGVDTAVKHFPGLGRVTGNTDTTAGVTDRVTTAHDAYLGPFRQAVRAGSPFLMMSTAIYARIDPALPAAFSPKVVGLTRSYLGFSGVVISDDLASARQVARWSPGTRAVLFLRAGGDMVLTVDPAVLPSMYDAVLARARSDAGFRAQVAASALRVLRAKAARGLLTS